MTVGASRSYKYLSHMELLVLVLNGDIIKAN